ncbi:MAG: hypothetical protein CMJ82_07775 [Planctomycetaceae bacterium]|nr:hypothetical protein [Planctomycetaceae bacterium]
MNVRPTVVFGLLLLTLSTPAVKAQEFVKSPRVRAIVEKGIGFLESDLTGQPQMGKEAYGDVLVGYTIYKYHDVFNLPGGKTHPKVKAAREKALAAVQTVANDQYTGEKKYYVAAVAALFFLDTDPDAYRTEIAKLIAILVKGQKKNGAWGYPNSDPKEGDNSVTQFVVLALWMAQNRGFEVDIDTLAAVTNWFLRTQAPDGAWGYHGNDPESFKRISQEVKSGAGGDNNWGHQSDAACGASSLYILAGTLGFVNQKPKAGPKKVKTSTSTAIKLKEEDEGFTPNPLTDKVDRGYLIESLKLTDKWFAGHFRFDRKSGRKAFYQNIFKGQWARNLTAEEPARWPFYSFYIFERYQTFRALAEQKSLMSEPDWYSRGLSFMQSVQRDDGSLTAGTPSGGEAMDTCFGLLFLMRSTLKSVSNLARDTQFISLGELPEDAANARIVDGKIVTSELGGDIGNLLDQLEGLDPEKFENMKKFPKVLELSEDEEERRAQIARVKSMISEGAPAARRVAIRAYAREQGLDAVPILLYALTDPDVVATQEARNALRFISRRLNGFGLPDNPTPEEKAEAIAKWRNWYLQVRPEAELEEDGVPGVSQ